MPDSPARRRVPHAPMPPPLLRQARGHCSAVAAGSANRRAAAACSHSRHRRPPRLPPPRWDVAAATERAQTPPAPRPLASPPPRGRAASPAKAAGRRDSGAPRAHSSRAAAARRAEVRVLGSLRPSPTRRDQQPLVEAAAAPRVSPPRGGALLVGRLTSRGRALELQVLLPCRPHAALGRPGRGRAGGGGRRLDAQLDAPPPPRLAPCRLRAELRGFDVLGRRGRPCWRPRLPRRVPLPTRIRIQQGHLLIRIQQRHREAAAVERAHYLGLLAARRLVRRRREQAELEALVGVPELGPLAQVQPSRGQPLLQRLTHLGHTSRIGRRYGRMWLGRILGSPGRVQLLRELDVAQPERHDQVVLARAQRQRLQRLQLLG
eukprot:scaffold9782_cov58-Phaeocystis_antarctica.AAC.2